jgi:hypothetical protein
LHSLKKSLVLYNQIRKKFLHNNFLKVKYANNTTIGS